jgi:hypothetical protein
MDSRLSSPAGRAAAAVVIALAVMPARARAFHEGGVGECEGCHTMHNSEESIPGVTSAYLLRGGDASSRCLYCHAGLVPGGVSVLTTGVPRGLPPANYTPGGDFGWLDKSYAWSTPTGLETSPPESHGHNVVAADLGLYADPATPQAPGGTYPSAQLSCISCHDPHGRFRINAGSNTPSRTGKPIVASGSYGEGAFRQPTDATSVGTYRLLAGAGYAPKSAHNAPTFSTNPPVALSPTAFNRSERVTETRVAYGAGMSEWCGNCHGQIHTPTSSASDFLHPSGSSAKLSAGLAAIVYNMYVKTGDLTGTQSVSYSSLVPYEEGTADRTTLAMHARSDGGALSGPGTGAENVMCLSCHRAHATAWDHALRWNQRATYLVADGLWPGTDSVGSAQLPENAQGRTIAETRGAMYDRDPTRFARFQTSLCNKCHGK